MVDSIGIVGYGFVGQAIAFGFSPVVDVRVYDKDPLLSMNTLEETINNSDIVFVCVPTPMKPDSSIDLSIVESVFQNIAEVNKNKENVIVLKSTVIPGTTESLSNKYSSLNIVFNPEFLTERKAKFDFLNQSRVILGGDEASTKKVASLYNKRFKTLQIIFSDSKTAELVKYFNNVFFNVETPTPTIPDPLNHMSSKPFPIPSALSLTSASVASSSQYAANNACCIPKNNKFCTTE